jgi:hypothetical protein
MRLSESGAFIKQRADFGQSVFRIIGYFRLIRFEVVPGHQLASRVLDEIIIRGKLTSEVDGSDGLGHL